MFGFIAIAATLQSNPLEKELIRLTEEYVEAVRTYNIKRMSDFFHPSYLEISPRGVVEDKAQILKSFDLPEERRFVANRVTLSDWKMSFPRRDLASVTFKQTYVFIRNEKEFIINVRVSTTWLNEKRKWVMTLQQSAPLDFPKPPKSSN